MLLLCILGGKIKNILWRREKPLYKTGDGAGKMVRALAAKSGALSLIFGAHTQEEIVPVSVLFYFHKCATTPSLYTPTTTFPTLSPRVHTLK